MRKDGSGELAVEIPSPGRDKPGWIRVGVIAAVGFVVGIAWPRIVGVRLGPSAPGEAAAAAAAAASASAGHGSRAAEAPPASVPVKGAAQPSASASTSAAPPAPKPGAAAPPNITVQKGNVLSCKTAEGDAKRGRDCGGVAGLDQVVSPRIRKIATCSGVEGQTGKLIFVANADFNSGRFWYDINKSSTVTNLEAVTTCLKTTFHNTTVNTVPHEHARYTVSYTAIFTPGTGGGDNGADVPGVAKDDKADKTDKADKKAKDLDEKPEAPASGEMAIAWEVALVRDTPKTGQVVARLPRGTKVKIGSTKDGWYAIKYGEGFASDGWVYRGAVGR